MVTDAENLRCDEFVIRAAFLYDGDGSVLERPLIHVRDGIIVLVEERGTDLPASSQVIDLPDAGILPGLIDAHVHLASYPDEDLLSTMRLSIAERAIRSAVNARDTLEAGFTTVRDCAADSLIDVAVKHSVETGRIPGPRLQISCRGLSITGGHGDHSNGFPPDVQFSQRYVVDGPDGFSARLESRSETEQTGSRLPQQVESYLQGMTQFRGA